MIQLVKYNRHIIVIVAPNYKFIHFGQETAKGPFGHPIKLPLAHLSSTHSGGFTLPLLRLNVKQGSFEYQLLQSLVWPDRESNPGQPFQ